MKITHTGVYVGANRHHSAPVIRLTVDFGRADGDKLARELAGFMEKLGSWGSDRGWLDGARSPGFVMASLASELLKRSGGKAFFRDARPVPKSEEQYVLFGYDGEEVGLAAGDLALDILDHMTSGDRA
jgi:hypothetical protein